MGVLYRRATMGDLEVVDSERGHCHNLKVSKMTIEENGKELKEAFSLFDDDKDGFVTMDELRKLIEKVGGHMTEAEAGALIHLADRDGNNCIDFSEFSKLWSAIRLEGEGEEEVREEFSKLDTDNSGFITKDEMLAVIANCEHFVGDKGEEAKRCVDELDVDKDGQVSYPEFLLVWKYKK